MNVLVTGFGPFLEVGTNPTEPLVRALDGSVVGGYRVEGLVLPTSYAHGPPAALARARELNASLVMGFGVASRREGVWVECLGRCVAESRRPDVEGSCTTGLVGSDCPATIDTANWCEWLDAKPSQDAGDYVCNAWLHTMASNHGNAGFVHVPREGMAPERFLSALGEWARLQGTI